MAPIRFSASHSGWPTLEEELRLWRRGFVRLAGLDEAGRGAWAGPVVAAAVILPADPATVEHALAGVRDSKALSATRREILYERVVTTALAVEVAGASAGEIDALGIVPATCLAMQRALAQLCPAADHLLIDHLRLTAVPLPQLSLPKGDARVLSIAAASIVAKVSRDRLMAGLEACYPGYGFAAHKGYGTAGHRAALARLGPCPVHRRSFAPLRAPGGLPV